MPRRRLPMKGEVVSFGGDFTIIPGMAHVSRGPDICFNCQYGFQKTRDQTKPGKCRKFAQFMDLPIKNVPNISMNNKSCRYFERRDV